MQTSKSVKPHLDIIDFGDNLCILVELPSVHKKDILLEIINDTLHLEAQMSLSIGKDERIISMDFVQSLYTFNFKLSDSLNHESLIAEMHNGLLFIRLEYMNKNENKHIPIKFI